MAGFSFLSTPQTNASTMVRNMLTNLFEGGGTAWFNKLSTTFPIDLTEKTIWLVESAPNVDAFLNTDPTQKYRLAFVLTKNTAANAPNPVTSVVCYYGDADQLKLNNDQTDLIVNPNTPSIQVMHTSTMMASITNEVNYRVTLTDRGWGLSIWPTARVNEANYNTMIVMQRPVNPTTGLPKVEGKAPIFAFWHGSNHRNGSGGTTASADLAQASTFNWGVVREIDLSASTYLGSNTSTGVGARTNPNRYNFYKLSLDWSHPNLFDNNSHVVKFPYGFATYRHLYLDELDLLCYVNAAAYAGKQAVKITMYGETVERTYQTTWGEVAYGYNTGQVSLARSVAGARIGLLATGGGIPVPPTTP